MKNKIILALTLALVVGFALVAHAVTLNLSLPLTSKELKGIKWFTDIENQRRTNSVPPLSALSNSDSAELKIREILNYFGDKAIEAERAERALKYESLSAPNKATVDAILQ